MDWLNCELCSVQSQKQIHFFSVDTLSFVLASFCNRCPAFYLPVSAREGHQLFNLYWGKKSGGNGIANCRENQLLVQWDWKLWGLRDIWRTVIREGCQTEYSVFASIISTSRKSKCQEDKESAREARDMEDMATDVLTLCAFRTSPSKKLPSLADDREKPQRRNEVKSPKIISILSKVIQS